MLDESEAGEGVRGGGGGDATISEGRGGEGAALFCDGGWEWVVSDLLRRF